jgi:hypothetical protein
MQRKTLSLTSILEIPNVSSGAREFISESSSFCNEKAGELVDPFRLARVKKRAQVRVMSAIRSGILIRPGVCSECGKRPDPPVGYSLPQIIEAHHDNYDEPLKVRWLCARCHNKADRIRRCNEGRFQPVCYDFVDFLRATGEYSLPFQCDPPMDDDYIYRSIRSINYAGLDRRQAPQIDLVLSCGHVEISPPGVLLSLPTNRLCHPCTESRRDMLRQRAERRRARRMAR